MGEFQPYPSVRYHYSGETRIVQNREQDEELRLRGGWTRSPTAFDPYKAPRQTSRRHDPVKWVDQWLVEGPVEGPDESLREKIKIPLFRAHDTFWKAPHAPNADTEAMRRAFSGVAQVLFDAGLLSRQFLEIELPRLVWDSAIAGGWWPLASEAAQEMFPEKLGHYWVWRDDSRNWDALFAPETAEWRMELARVAQEREGSVRGVPFQSSTPDRASKRVERRRRWEADSLDGVRSLARDLLRDGTSHLKICRRLGDMPRPPHAAWRHLAWDKAYLHPKYKGAVSKWISRNCRS